MKKICLVSIVTVILYILCGCSSSSNNIPENSEFDNPFSREAVDYLASRDGFGRGRTDIETVVLKFIYQDPSFAEKYGDAFCVDNIGGTDEGSTFLFSWIYKASGNYFVEIDGDTWWINVSKSYWGKWEVIHYYQEVKK